MILPTPTTEILAFMYSTRAATVMAYGKQYPHSITGCADMPYARNSTARAFQSGIQLPALCHP